MYNMDLVRSLIESGVDDSDARSLVSNLDSTINAYAKGYSTAGQKLADLRTEIALLFEKQKPDQGHKVGGKYRVTLDPKAEIGSQNEDIRGRVVQVTGCTFKKCRDTYSTSYGESEKYCKVKTHLMDKVFEVKAKFLDDPKDMHHVEVDMWVSDLDWAGGGRIQAIRGSGFVLYGTQQVMAPARFDISPKKDIVR